MKADELEKPELRGLNPLQGQATSKFFFYHQKPPPIPTQGPAATIFIPATRTPRSVRPRSSLEQRAAESVFSIQGIQQARIDFDADIERAVQPDAGRVGRHAGMDGTAFEQPIL